MSSSILSRCLLFFLLDSILIMIIRIIIILSSINYIFSGLNSRGDEIVRCDREIQDLQCGFKECRKCRPGIAFGAVVSRVKAGAVQIIVSPPPASRNLRWSECRSGNSRRASLRKSLWSKSPGFSTARLFRLERNSARCSAVPLRFRCRPRSW